MSPRLEVSLRPAPAKARLTTYMLSIAVDGQAAWPVLGAPDVALEVQIDDLLAHLTEFWKPLMLRQVYPIDVSPLRPSDLSREATRRWGGLQAATVEKEEEAVADFEEAHDLARAFSGLFDLPSFWILRAGSQVVLETSGMLWQLPFNDVRVSLSSVGEQICDLLAAADVVRWEAAIDAWHQRDNADPVSLLSWSAGLNRALASALINEGALTAPRDFDDAANDSDELRIAARMAGALPSDQIREIIAFARKFSKRDADGLRTLANSCAEYIAADFGDSAPFIQGEVAARFARERLGIPRDGAVDIFAIAKNLGIDVRTALIEPPALSGLAIWGSQHGPGVFLNEASRRILPRAGRVEDSPGARVTLAHELCHLLLDGGNALSAIEVLKARMPVGVEQRAKSFAGSFLLPGHVAAATWFRAGRPFGRDGVGGVVSDLIERYGVTRSVAAWKLEHGVALHDVDLSAVLDSVAPRR